MAFRSTRYFLAPVNHVEVPAFWRALQSVKANIIQLGKEYSPTSEKEFSQQETNNRRMVEWLSRQKVRKVSLQQLSTHAKLTNDPGQLLRNAQFLHEELPVRFAQRAIELECLPHGLPQMHTLQQLSSWYAVTAVMLFHAPCPKSIEEEEEYARLLANVLLQPHSAPQAIAHALHEWLRDPDLMHDKPKRRDINIALNRFFSSRISLRLLMEHYVASRTPNRGFSGIIQSDCNPYEIAQFAADEIRRVLKAHYGVAPIIQMYGEKDKTFAYLPNHLYYIMYEILMNASKATILRGQQGPQHLPPVRVVVAHGSEDITIKVADKAGGFGRSKDKNVWSYLYSSRPYDIDFTWEKDRDGPLQKDDPGTGLPFISSHGMGLPLSRLYARYFGGELHVIPTEGYGTDCYVHLCRVGGENSENLPD